MAISALLLAGPAIGATDPKNVPPAHQEVCSTSRSFCLSLTVKPSKPARAVAEMKAANGSIVWTRILPHESGPRFVLIADSGETILLDEWINVASHLSIVILGTDGSTVTQAAFSEIEALLGIPGKKIVHAARFGAWMSDQPRFVSPGIAKVASAGRTIVVRLAGNTVTVE